MKRFFPDISFWQGKPNFDIMKQKTDYVILKSSQGLFADPQFFRNRSESVRVGLAWGIYHFYDDRYSPGDQAQTVINILKNYPQPLEIWCDWEKTYGGSFSGVKNVVAFMERLEELSGKKVGMYTGYYWFFENTNPLWNIFQYSYLKDKPLWLAWYTDDFTNKDINRVKIPGPWTKMSIWQYGTPAIAYQYGVTDSKEIDMNERIGDNPDLVIRKITQITVKIGA